MFFKRICSRPILFVFVPVLPISDYQSDPDSTDLQVGLHGGGRFASVGIGCEGHVAATGSGYEDIACKAYLRFPPKSDSPIVVGVRGGCWKSDLRLPVERYVDGQVIYDERTVAVSYEYFNPSIAVDFRNFGFGVRVGYLFGDVLREFEERRITRMRSAAAASGVTGFFNRPLNPGYPVRV